MEQHLSKDASRRDFLKKAGATAAGLLLVKPESVRGTPANSAITVGVLGPGRRGTSVARHFLANSHARLVALCDIFDDQIAAAKERLKLDNIKVYKNHQELLGSDLDAVLIATPPYQHPEQFEAAVAAKKSIYLEKPVAVDADGERKVAAAARRAEKERSIAIGFQRRWSPVYLQALEKVKEGAIGEIQFVRASWLGGDLPRRKGHPESEEKIRNWLFYRDRSGDIMTEQNCHNLDAVNWFLAAHPVRAIGYGGRNARKDIGDIYDHFTVSFEYANGVRLSYSSSQFCKGWSHVAEQFIGTKGVLDISLGGATISTADNRTLWKSEGIARDSTKEAVDTFLASIKDGKFFNMGVAAAESTMTSTMALNAVLSGREATWPGLA